MSMYSLYMFAAHIRQANYGNPGRPSSTQRQRFAFRLLAAEDLALAAEDLAMLDCQRVI